MLLGEVLSDRLRLRPVSMDDAHDIYEYMCMNEVTRWLFTACPYMYECLRYIKTELLIYNRTGLPSQNALELLESGKVIGTCNYHSVEDDTAQLGFILNPTYQHQGYMQEALEVLLTQGFTTLGYRRIIAMHMIGNEACQRLLEQLGFVKEGVLREACMRDQEALTMVLYSYLEREWREKNERISNEI